MAKFSWFLKMSSRQCFWELPSFCWILPGNDSPDNSCVHMPLRARREEAWAQNSSTASALGSWRQQPQFSEQPPCRSAEWIFYLFLSAKGCREIRRECRFESFLSARRPNQKISQKFTPKTVWKTRNSRICHPAGDGADNSILTNCKVHPHPTHIAHVELRWLRHQFVRPFLCIERACN